MGGEYDALVTVQESKIWSYEQMVYAQPRIPSWAWDGKSYRGISDTSRSLNLN